MARIVTFGELMLRLQPFNYERFVQASSVEFTFGGMKFLPTGGVNNGNIKEFIDAPFIHAVGGSWVCPKADIAAGNWEKITQLCIDARKAAKGE